MTRVACLAVIAFAVWAAPAQAAELSLAGRFSVVPPPGVVSTPSDVAVDAEGFVYVLTGAYVQRYDPTGVLQRTWGGMGPGSGQFLPPIAPHGPVGPKSLDVDRGGRVYVADGGGNRVVVFTRDGDFVANWGRNGGDGTSAGNPGEFDGPGEIVVEPSGNVLVLDNPFGVGGLALQRLSPTGQPLARTPGESLTSLAAGENGAVYARNFREVVNRFDAGSLAPLGAFDLRPPHPTQHPHSPVPASCCGIVALSGSIWLGKLPAAEIQRYTPGGTFVSACALLPGGVPAFTGAADDLAAGHDGLLYVLRRERLRSEVLRLRIDDASAPPCQERVEPPPPQPDDRPRLRSLRLTIGPGTARAIRARQLPLLWVVYSTSTDGRVVLRVTRLVAGRRVGGRCRRAPVGMAGRPRCARRIPRATLRLTTASGLIEHSYRLADGLRPRSLRPGRYELTATAIDAAGAQSAPARVGLRVWR